MATHKVHLRLYILYELPKAKNVTNAFLNLVNDFSEDAVSNRRCKRGFGEFVAGYFNLNNKPRSRRPFLINDGIVKTMLKLDPFSIKLWKRLTWFNKPFSDHIRKYENCIVFFQTDRSFR